MYKIKISGQFLFSIQTGLSLMVSDKENQKVIPIIVGAYGSYNGSNSYLLEHNGYLISNTPEEMPEIMRVGEFRNFNLKLLASEALPMPQNSGGNGEGNPGQGAAIDYNQMPGSFNYYANVDFNAAPGVPNNPIHIGRMPHLVTRRFDIRSLAVPYILRDGLITIVLPQSILDTYQSIIALAAWFLDEGRSAATELRPYRVLYDDSGENFNYLQPGAKDLICSDYIEWSSFADMNYTPGVMYQFVQKSTEGVLVQTRPLNGDGMVWFEFAYQGQEVTTMISPEY